MPNHLTVFKYSVKESEHKSDTDTPTKDSIIVCKTFAELAAAMQAYPQQQVFYCKELLSNKVSQESFSTVTEQLKSRREQGFPTFIHVDISEKMPLILS